MIIKLQYTSVKIITTINGNTSFGSGTIVKKSDKYYVISACHCVYGKKGEEDIFNDVKFENITIEYRYNFNDSPETIPVISIVEKDSNLDYIILEIEYKVDNFPDIHFGYFNDEKKISCFLRGYAKAHENEPRDYNCILNETTDDELLLKFVGDTLSQPVDYGSDIISGFSGSGIFYGTNNELFLIGVVLKLRDENGTFDDFFGIPINKIPFLSDQIKPIRSYLMTLNANNLIDKFKTKLGIPYVDFIINNSELPQYESHLSNRNETVNILVNKLKEAKWIAIYGEIYSGKTELLKLINYALSEIKYTSIYIKIQRLESEERIIEKIKNTLSEPNIKCIIIDNMPLLTRNSTLLQLIINLIERTEIKFISSSRHFLPDSISMYENIIRTKVPEFTVEETKDIISSYNPSIDIIDKYAIFILTISNKNPAIVSSLCYFLNEKGWSIDTKDFNRILTGDFNTEFQIELNEELITTVTDPINRELLNRLQLHNGNFNRETARRISNVSPEIPEFNSRFFNMTGSWLISTNNNEYKVSPLLQIINSGQPDLPNPIIQSVSIVLAENILRKKDLNQYDIQKIILYYVRADRPNEAGYFYIRYIVVAIDNIEIAKNTFLSYYWTDTSLPEMMDIELKIQIRALQSYLLLEIGNDNSYSLLDLEALLKISQRKGFSSYIGNIALGSMHYDPLELNPKSFKYLFESYTMQGFLDSKVLGQIDKRMDDIEMLWFMFSQIASKKDIDSWIVILKDTINIHTPEEIESSSILEPTTFLFYRRYKENAEMTLDKNQSCDFIITELLYLLDKLKKYKLEKTIIITTCVVIQLHNRNGSNHDALNLFKKEISITDNTAYKGVLYFAIINTLIKDKEELEKLLTDEVEKTFSDSLKIESMLYSSTILDGLCSLTSFFGNLKTEKYLYYSKLAYEYSIEENNHFDIITQSFVIGEYAVALLMNNHREECIDILDIGFRKLLSDTSNNDAYRALIVKYGILIRHIALDPEDDEYATPHAGMFLSNSSHDRLVEIYDPIRDFINSNMMFDIYLNTDNRDKTKYWALNSYNTGKIIDKNPFTILMIHFIPYLIEEKLYEEVISILYKDNEEVERIKKGNSQYKNIMKRMQPERDTSNYIEIARNSTNDEEALRIYIIPMVINALHYRLENEDDKYLYHITKILKRHLNYCTDTTLIQNCIAVIESFIDKNGEIKYTDYTNIKSKNLLCLIYLMSSISLDVKDSFEMQMKSMEYVDDLFNIYKTEKGFLLYSYFKNFWLRRITNSPSKFSNRQHLIDKGLRIIENGDGKPLNRLFKVLSNHIDVTLNVNQEDWLYL